MKRVLPFVAVLLVAVAALVWWRTRPRGGEAVPAARPVPAAPAAEKPAVRPPRVEEAPPSEPRLAQDDDPPGKLRLEGQVIDEAEKPVAGARVALSANPGRQVKSEQDGSFVFDKLVGRTYRVEAVLGDRRAGPLSVRVSEKTEPLILRLTRGGALEVTVVDAEGRAPVAGAEVELASEASLRAGTGDGGKATLSGVGAGWHELRVDAVGFAPESQLVQTSGHAGIVDRQTVELRRGAPVSGLVVDADGKPVAGARILPEDAARPFSGLDRKRGGGSSDAQGRWRFILAAGTFRFSASHEGFAPGVSTPVTLDGKRPREGVLITLSAGGHVAGRVIDKSGAPVPAAVVRASLKGGGMAWDVARQAFSDAQGRFDIKGLPRRKLELTALGESGPSDALDVDLAARPEQTELSLVINAGGTIEGLVVTSKGGPVPQAQVSALPAIGAKGRLISASVLGYGSDVTDEGGRFTLRGLAEGEYRVVASRTGGLERMWAGAGTPAKTGDHDVRIVLESDGHVKGHVLFADGSAPDSFTVAVGFGAGQAFSGGEGAFRVDAPGGTSNLTVSGPSLVRKIVPDVAVKGDEDTDVGTITVEKGRSLSGRVWSEGGTPVGGAQVLAGPQLIGTGAELSMAMFGSRMGIKSTTSDDDGSFLISGVGERKLVIAAEHPTEGRSPMVPVVGGNDSVVLTLVLGAPGSLEGKVTSGGQPVADAMVVASPQAAARSNFMVKTGDDGAYRFDKLAADTYNVSAVIGNLMGAKAMETRTATVQAGATASVDIELPVGGVTVMVTVVGKDGAKIQNSQLILMSGVVAVTSVDQLYESIAQRGQGSMHPAFALKGQPAKLEDVPPGAYSACAVRLPDDLNSLADLQKLQERVETLPIACTAVTVAASPAEQSFTVTMP